MFDLSAFNQFSGRAVSTSGSQNLTAAASTLRKLFGSESGVASNPDSTISRWYSGVDKSARLALTILSTIEVGVPAGASRP